MRLSLCLLALLNVQVSGAATHPWEWAGTFDLVAGTKYTWLAQKKKAKATTVPQYAYADPAMKLAIVQASANTKAGLEAAEATATTLYSSSATTVNSLGSLTTNSLMSLSFDQDTTQSIFKLTVPTTAAYAFFAEHLPTEFEDTYHYLKDKDNTDIEPGAQEPDKKAATGNMAGLGTAFAASFMASAVSLVGVLILIPTVAKNISQSKAAAFGSGALIACAVFLMWPESVYLIGSLGKTEAYHAFAFGACVIAGFLTTVLVQFATTLIMGEAAHSHNLPRSNVIPAEVSNTEKVLAGEKVTTGGLDYNLICGVIVGDAFHNFVDGIVIGASFKTCATSTAWGVAASTIAHEIGQEFGDFLLLTKQGGLSAAKALLVNFCSACTCMLATLIVYETDPSDSDIGCLLAYGAGCYMYIATVPVFHQVVDQKTANDMMMHLFIFLVGVTVIGLVLLDHEHCSAPGAEPHAH